MTRLSLVGAVLLVLSALSLVSAQYRARQLFIDLDQARAAARKLDIEWRTLQLDQTNYSKNSLIEATAERDLRMRRPTPARTQFITLPEHPTAQRDLHPAGSPSAVAGPRAAGTADAAGSAATNAAVDGSSKDAR